MASETKDGLLEILVLAGLSHLQASSGYRVQGSRAGSKAGP